MGYTTSPLRYPGGKTRLANFIKHVVIANDMLNGDYIEPFAGGAGIAWSLLFQDYVSCVHINDLNNAVYAFWRSTFEDTEGLCRLINDTPVTMETWNQQRSIQANPELHSTLDVGFSAFFLNRTNRSGIMWGGVIGGKRQGGKWKLDARFNKEGLVKRIERIAHYKERVKLYNEDALDFVSKVLPALPGKSLVYLDPPYYMKGADLYENHYVHQDHVAVAKAIVSITQKWIVSYDDVPDIRKLYDGHRQLIYRLSYSAADRYSGAEVMYLCPEIVVPKVESPIGLKAPKSPPRHRLPDISSSEHTTMAQAVDRPLLGV